jgi:hypothetical protein
VPIETRAPDTKPLPDTVIVVPPVRGPLAGDTDVTVGRVPVPPVLVPCVNAPARMTYWPLGLVTRTSRAPAAAGGVVARSWVELTKTTLLATSVPMETRAPETKPVPVTVMTVPPAVGPLAGETLVSVRDDVGGGGAVP